MSTYHVKIKFPVAGGVGESQADVLQEHKCYVEAIKRGKKRVLEEASGEETSNKRGKDPVPRPELKEEAPIAVQPVEELVTVELIPGPRGDRPRCHYTPPQPRSTIKPVKKKKRHFGLEKDKIIQGQLNKLLAAGHIREIQFLEWLSNMVLVPKPGIEANPDKMKAILDMGPPTNINEVQRLIGRIAALSRFISKSAEKGLPFFKTLRKVKNFEWTEECQQAFEDLKTYLGETTFAGQPDQGEIL
ncbi:UNVERIFIED_CONTAM: hypothetical protein Slati_4551400 [Sesamum latifolium]|uniref:Reverse transcriptase/retrotransposon-derived protein RNase H-like domain-containing protein n=1 Tax=Sesamum latifolium TaxID=2727402 RepID=A0AAW2S2X2_9LAMI